MARTGGGGTTSGPGSPLLPPPRAGVRPGPPRRPGHPHPQRALAGDHWVFRLGAARDLAAARDSGVTVPSASLGRINVIRFGGGGGGGGGGGTSAGGGGRGFDSEGWVLGRFQSREQVPDSQGHQPRRRLVLSNIDHGPCRYPFREPLAHLPQQPPPADVPATGSGDNLTKAIDYERGDYLEAAADEGADDAAGPVEGLLAGVLVPEGGAQPGEKVGAAVAGTLSGGGGGRGSGGGLGGGDGQKELVGGEVEAV
ncbi:hypothetical protein COCNU_08G001370 [Cocos nucifera]|uniref:Uncharacterized protein n=1 Tax=Cocos nucifera TaxID=13894 RepID=A0A8K0N5Q9_COCNU|nr:hypothetical protein COCNU_08G001370 [Cocos nucifera]